MASLGNDYCSIFLWLGVYEAAICGYFLHLCHSDDSESLSSFKEDGNGSDASDDMPAKRNKVTVKKELDADKLDSGTRNGFGTAAENVDGSQEGMWANEV